VQQVHADADGSKRNVGNLYAVLVPPSCHAALEGDTTFPSAVDDRTAFDAAAIPEFAGLIMQRQVDRLEGFTGAALAEHDPEDCSSRRPWTNS
jgi:hypothetical protein